ncbi:Heat shock 70 kDa protein 17 [Diplonema papillatum]|nr:Heat shock 70 kDa protein 17 [Diplonema papillatum]
MAAPRCALLAVLAGAVSAQLIGIDLGSEYIKVAGVRPSTGIDVVLNEQSKRKSDNYIGFRGDDRFLGEDAHNLAPRFPQQMYTFLNRLAGHKWEDKAVLDLFKNTWNLPYNFVENKNRSTIDIMHEDPPVEFTPEELLAQLFGYVKGQADTHLEMEVTGAVVVVPHFFTISQRQAIFEAANLTGLPVAGFITPTLSAALQYGVQRRGFENDTVHLVVYDMGSSKTEVGVFRFSPAEVDAKGKPKKGAELGKLEQLAITYDETLGGRTFDARIANFLAKKFEAKNPSIKLLGATDKSALKAMTVLMKSASKAKEVLSANKQAIVAVEELYDGKPFFYTLQREELDQECEDIFQRATPLLTKALAQSGVSIDDIRAIEVIGGGIRIPRLQVALSESVGGRSLDKTLNGDECMALGATFQVARLGKGSFRTKGFDVADVAPYNVTFKLSQKPGSDKEPKMRPLFTNSRYGVKKSITVSRDTDFELSLYLSKTEGDKEVSTMLRKYHVQDVATILDGFGYNKADKNESNANSVNAVIELTQAGLVELSALTVKYDENVVVIKKIKVKEPKTEETKAKEGDDKDAAKEDDAKSEDADDKEKTDEADATADEEKKDDNAEKKEGEEEPSTDGEDKKDDADKKEFTKKQAEKKEEKAVYVEKEKHVVKKHRSPAKVSATESVPAPMYEKDYARSKALLDALQKIDDLKREAAAAKNDLETYMYAIKYDDTGVLENEELQPYITEEEKEKLTALIEETSEWAEYGEGSEDATKAEKYIEKRLELVKMVKVFTDKKKAADKAANAAKAKEEEAAEQAKEPADKAAPADDKAEAGEEDNGEDETVEE